MTVQHLRRFLKIFRVDVSFFVQEPPSDIICINIRGKRFLVLGESFNRFPETRLGKLVQCNTNDERLKLCHRFKDGDVPEYYYDM